MRHDMYLYEDDDSLAGRMGAFLDDGLARGDAVLAVVDARKWGILRDALGDGAERVTHIHRDVFYTRRPEAAIAAYDAMLRRVASEGTQEVRIFGELPACRTRQDQRTWGAYEAIVNRALAHHRTWVMCGYDARETSDALLRDGRRTHAAVLTDGWATSAHFDDPAAVVRSLTPAPEPLPDLPALPADGDARALREGLLEAMATAGVRAAEADDMLLAAGEVLANARRHGGGLRSLRAGSVGDRFVCELGDGGPGLDDPLAGHLPPRHGDVGGAGLWVARQVTRRVELMGSTAGLTVRLWV
jgi:anti-sigma regulatory factor (Ser/Thr protein kinase)